MKKFSIFLVIFFVFLSAFKVPATSAVSTLNNKYNPFTWLINGIYYNELTNDYMLIINEEIPDEFLINIMAKDTDDVLYNFTTDLQNYVVFGDIVKFDADNDYFSWWWGEYYEDISLFENFYVYIIVGGYFFPPLSPQVPIIQFKIIDTNYIIPLRPKEWVSDIVYLINSSISYTEEDLQREFDRGYNFGYDAGYNIGFNRGYNEGHATGYNSGYSNGQVAGYNSGYEQGYNVGYSQGYDTGISEQLEYSGFSTLLRSAFLGIGSFLGINILPGVSIGAIIAVPIVFGIISFIIGKRKD